MKSINFFIIFLATAILFSGCKSSMKTGQAGAAKKNSISEKDKTNYEFKFHNATKEKILGNIERAANLYAECVKINNTQPTPYYELAGIYDQLGKHETALDFSKQAAKLEPENVWFQLQYAGLLQKNGQNKKAVSVYEKLVKDNPEKIEFYYDLTNAYLYENELQKAIQVYDNLEKIIGVSEEVSVQKQRIYSKMGQSEKAISEIQKLINNFPKNGDYYIMLSEIYRSSNNNEKALEALNKGLEMDAENAYIHLSFADYYKSKNEKEKSFEHLKKAFSNTNLDVDNKVKILFNNYYQISDTANSLKSEAFTLAEILIETHPLEAKGYTIYGDFLVRDKKYKEAREQFRKAIIYDKNKFDVWRALLDIDAELMDYEMLEKESKEAKELFPTQPFFYYYNGTANLQMQKFNEAIEVLELGVALVVDNKELSTLFYSNLGEAYYKLKKHKRSDECYDKALQHDPNNIFVLNNYGYYLSLRNEKLEKAEEMSKRSNSLEPNNANFQDTYGWILYQNKKYAEAKTWIEKALQSGGSTNGVIIEHYGDVLFRLNEKEKALEQWKKAKETGRTSELIDRKISEKKLIE